MKATLEGLRNQIRKDGIPADWNTLLAIKEEYQATSVHQRIRGRTSENLIVWHIPQTLIDKTESKVAEFNKGDTGRLTVNFIKSKRTCCPPKSATLLVTIKGLCSEHGYPDPKEW